ncbi:putative laccase [Tanacetum coccineum]
MILELADRSIQYPRGIAENVIIKIDKFILPIDFVILDMREDSKIPIILRRPFLATARAMIDVFNKKITLRVGNEEVIFDVDQSIKRPPTEDDECYGIDYLDTTIHSKTQELLEDDQLDSFLVNNLEKSIDQSDLESCGKDDCSFESRTPIQRIEQVNTSKGNLYQRIDGIFKPIYYASKTLNDAQAHYTTTEKELLAADAKPRLIRWVLQLQGFNIGIKDKKGDKKGVENLAAEHLSRLKNPNMGELAEDEIGDKFPDDIKGQA